MTIPKEVRDLLDLAGVVEVPFCSTIHRGSRLGNRVVEPCTCDWYRSEGALEHGEPSDDGTLACAGPSVYPMRMARVNVYLPDDLASEAKAAGLNVSSLTQEALRSALAAVRVDEWLDDVGAMRPLGISHTAVISAVSAAKRELEGDG